MERTCLTIVICTRNRSDDLATCMHSIMIQTLLPDEIVIVDSSDDALSQKLVESYANNGPINVKYVHTNPGLTKQRNIGISESTGDIIAFLDDDVLLDKNYLYEIVKCFDSSEDVVGVGGKIINEPQISPFGRWFRKLFLLTTSEPNGGIMQRSGLVIFQKEDTPPKVQATEILCGCSCYRKEVFLEYQFDEHFEGYGFMEDVDFSYRISRQYRLLNTPFAKFVHNHSPNARLDLKKLHQMRILNYYYVFSKNVKKRKIDWVFFYWGNLGTFLTTLTTVLRSKTLLPLVGMYLGYKEIFRSLFRY